MASFAAPAASSRFERLGSLSVEAQWLANFASPCTRRAYAADVGDFVDFCGVDSSDDLLQVGRSHVLAWRHHLEADGLSPSTQRRKLAALSSLLEHLVDERLIPSNPARGVRRPRLESHEGKTPALSLDQARALLDAPDPQSPKGIRDRAILAVMLLGGLRRAEVVALRVKDFYLQRSGVQHLRVLGKGGKVRFIPVPPLMRERVQRYLDLRGVAQQGDERLFVRLETREGKGGAGAGGRCANATREGCDEAFRPTSASLSAGALATRVVRPYLAQIGVVGERFSAHALRVTAATLALHARADLNEVRHFLGHACISTTTTYDRRARDAGTAVSLMLPL
ncbi:tyrosine-type recombinase/integrase [Calothrix sp. FACHB-1219]|uniref:tyrosine-type recombinase/integrase n=1 Tax=Calothrix sp. FACHB-1219 TaxID=2692778 RepID=UPI001688A63F|nr:tyrosine-type recombinase/integrase [Calothrix sp. FACHB-1219]MBD2222787.1 tyrosine-type recombinase/integrase [Calothrix sp. FACHB-1219]